MESKLTVSNVNISPVRRYSLAELDAIDFFTSDDLAVVVEKLRSVIILEEDIERYWNEKQEQLLWQFVIDSELFIFTCYFSNNSVVAICDVPKIPISELFFFIKVSAEKFTSYDCVLKLLYGRLKEPIFESLHILFSNVYLPMFSKSTEWSRCIKLYYQHQLTKFSFALFQVKNQLLDEIILYIPEEVMDKDIDLVIADEDLLNQVENAVMMWMSVLMNAFMKQDIHVVNNYGPMEEITFWETKYSKLDKILSQLNRKEVNLCIAVVKAANFASFHKFKELHAQLQGERDVAAETIEFLSILKPICLILQKSSLADIPENLSKLLDCVRIIWNNSSYYKDNETISNLLGKVNNFVIQVISQHISLNELLNAEINSQIQKFKLQDIISCCKSWIEIFNFSESVHRKFALNAWSVESISPLVNLFIHRCDELIEVCEYKEKFYCNFGLEYYGKISKFYKIIKQFKIFECQFLNFLKNLCECKYATLDVRKIIWNNYFKRFKRDVADLEMNVLKLMANSFENLSSFEDGIETLILFQKYFKKESIKHDVHRSQKVLYDVFMMELNYVKEKLIDLNAYEKSIYSIFGGIVFYTSTISRRIKHLNELSRQGNNIWSKEYNARIQDNFPQVLKTIEEYKYSLFLQWTKTISKDPYAWLKELIITQMENSLFHLNLSNDVLNMIFELFYWEKLQVEIPQQVIHLHEKRDLFLKRIFRLLDSVRSYNRIITSLSFEERVIFNDILFSMEENIKPALIGMNWSAPQSTIMTSLKLLTDQMKLTKEAFTCYDTCKTKIENLCLEISQKCLFFSNFMDPVKYNEFMEIQVKFKSKVLEEIKENFVSLTCETNKILEIVRLKKSKDNNSVEVFMKRIINSFSSALVSCYTSSLSKASFLFGASRRNKIHLMFDVPLVLKDNQLSFDPSFMEISSSVNQLFKDIFFSLSNLMAFEGISYENINGKENYFHAIDSSDLIKELQQDLDLGFSQLYIAEKTYRHEWKSYLPLWQTNKSDLLKCYQEHGWKASNFEKDINLFLDITKEVSYMPRYKTLEFCLVDCQSLKTSALAYGEKWKTELGEILSGISSTNLQNAYNLINIAEVKFQNIPRNLEELKCCIKFLIDARKYAFELQETLDSVEDYFAVLKKFQLPVSQKYLYQHQNLNRSWNKLENNFQNYYVKLQEIQAFHQRNFVEYHEELKNQANILKIEIETNGPYNLTYNYEDSVNSLSSYQQNLLFLQKQEERMKEDSNFFHLKLNPLKALEMIEEVLNYLKISWSFVNQYYKYLVNWSDIPVLKFDVTEKQKCIDNFYSDIKKLRMRVGSHYKLLDELVIHLDDLFNTFEIIRNLQEPCLQKRHFDQLREILKVDCEDSETFFQSKKFTFMFLMNFDLTSITNAICLIVMNSKKEYEIEQVLTEIKKSWEFTCFRIDASGKCCKFEDIKDILLIAEDQLITLSVIKSSRYASYFENSANNLENSLYLILDVINEIEYFQSKFYPMEEIFSQKTIQSRMSEIANKFQNVVELWRTSTVVITENKMAWEICHDSDFLEKLKYMNRNIEEAQKSLEIYLDSKRYVFPRFYFVSYDDLLKIIGLKTPVTIQDYLEKLFDSLNKLKIIEKIEDKLGEKITKFQITGMYSKCNEFVEFPSQIILEGSVDSWLLNVEKSMKSSLRLLLRKCQQMFSDILSKNDVELSLSEWFIMWPGQVCLVTIMIVWTADVTTSIKLVQESAVTSTLKILKKKWRAILQQCVTLLRQEMELLVQKKIMNALLTLTHSCDVIDFLIKYVCNDIGAFEWMVHIRYYFDEERSSCIIKQANATFKYGFEYLGNRRRLVITPVTDRCFLSLTVALYIHQGGFLKGRRNSGKTETLKELGKVLGNYVLVINCSESNNRLSITRILSGLAQIGAWGLFEGFNHITNDTVSLLSQEINCIFKALAQQKNVFCFLGKEISLKDNCGIFLGLTSDQYGANYGHLSNLSNLFRPLTLISPDTKTIIEVYLFAYGFQNPKIVASDIYLMYNKTREQLSNKHHYSFELREVIQFLKLLCSTKKDNPNLLDDEVIALSLRKTFLQKLEAFDIPIFENILNSVFGSVKSIKTTQSEFTENINIVLKNNHLHLDDSTVAKVIDLYEIKKFYHSVILLGMSGSGKTTTWKILKDVCSYQNQEERSHITSAKTYILNPKAYNLKEMFGYFGDNGVWINGIFPTVLKNACHDTTAKERWLVLCGPVDLEWMTNIHSLLDDSKVFMMINGERILLPNEVTLIFETTNLLHCSPSILSCTGIVYHNSISTWKLFLYSWLENLNNDDAKVFLKEMTQKYFDCILEFVFNALKSIKEIHSTHLNAVSSFTHIADMLFKTVLLPNIQQTALHKVFWMAVTLSFGMLINDQERYQFSSYIKSLDVSLSTVDFIYDYTLDSNFEWIKWSKIFPEKWNLSTNKSFKDSLVPTVSTVYYQDIISKLLEEKHPVLLVGRSGCGKTILMNNILSKLNPETYSYSVINVVPKITSSKLQNYIEADIKKQAGGVMLPYFEKKIINFLDDIAAVDCDKFGFQPPLELLRMVVDFGFLYDRNTWSLNHFQNVLCVATMVPHIDSQNKVPQSLLNRFHIMNYVSYQLSDMKSIFTTVLRHKIIESSFEIQRFTYSLIQGSIKAYETIKNTFLPTPEKLHYLFDFNGIKRVLNNFLNVSPELIGNNLSLTKFWFHEYNREFTNRLSNEDDRLKMFHILIDVLEKEFFFPVARICVEEEPIFLKFVRPESGYNEVQNVEILKDLFSTYVNSYKKECSHNSDIVLFRSAVEHILRIVRAIENNHGHVILLGANGTGRKTLCKIAAYILKFSVCQIISENFTEKPELKIELKKLLHDVGIKRKKVLLLISDNYTSDDSLLEILVDILKSGIPRDLYLPSELKMIFSKLSESSNTPLKGDQCCKLFASHIQSNFHLALCINFLSPLYKKCFVKYPVLCKNSAINWFDEWSFEVLEAVARHFLKDWKVDCNSQDAIRNCPGILSEMHLDILRYSKQKKNSICILSEMSSTFIKFVHSFKKVFLKSQQEIQLSLDKLLSGLQKINETQESVNEISCETKEAHKQLLIAELECDKALHDMQEKKFIVTEKEAKIQEKKLEIEKKEKICKTIAVAAQEDLNAALPALEQAQKTLESLNKQDIGEIKSYAKPPLPVEIVLQAVMILRKSEPSWTEAKRQLGSPTFLKELIEFDVDNIPDEVLEELEHFIKKPEFQPEKIGKVSFAAKSLSMWVRAMHLYGNIYKYVKPKKERLRVAQEELEKLQNTLTLLIIELEKNHAAIAQLETELNLSIEKKENYAKKEKVLAEKLLRAESIIESLRSQRDRWQFKVSTLTHKKAYVLGDSLLASGYLTYLGPYVQTYRMNACAAWKQTVEKKYLCNPAFHLSEFFIDDAILNEWKLCGLPNDQYSQESATILKESMWSFIIDPEEQAVKWIKNLNFTKKLKIIDCEDPSLMSVMKMAIMEGFPILIQNASPLLSSTLDSLLNVQDDQIIHFDNEKFHLNPDFQLYLSTMLPNPEFSCFSLRNICIVNFSIKEKGLQDQLLPLIIQNERPDIEDVKEKLAKDTIEYKKKLSDLENEVLKSLNAAHGSLLENEILIKTLHESKSLSIKIEMELITIEKSESHIYSTRNEYRPCAKLAAILYFVLTDMTYINPIYVFTLSSYIELFDKSIKKSSKDPDVSKRIEKLNSFHKLSVYRFACRSIPYKHSLLFAFHMCTQLLLCYGKLDHEEYKFFIHGGQILNPEDQISNPCAQWLTEDNWNKICQLEYVSKFLGISVSFDENPNLWFDWFSSPAPENKFLPSKWRNICTEFEKLLIIQCIRPDRIRNCIQNLITSNLGQNFITYPDFDIEDIFKESSANKPLLLLTFSPDIDPERIISKLANEFKIKYRVVSLIQGQEETASHLIVNSMKVGEWAVILNCHFLQSWLPILQKIISKLQTVKVNNMFRLWLSSSPTAILPMSILQNSVIISLDSPKAIQTNMMEIYNKITSECSIEFSTCEPKFKSLLYSLCFFHSLLLGRKRFQSMGWNGSYNFSWADFKVSMHMLHIYLNECKDTSWDALRKIISETVYGGHLTDKRDQKLLMDYYNKCVCEEAVTISKYPLSDVVDYIIPENGPLEVYINSIQSMPNWDVPEMFGQYSNAEILCQIYDSQQLIGDFSKIDRERIVHVESNAEITSIISQIKSQMPALIDEKRAARMLHDNPEPYNYILIQETKLYNNLLQLISTSVQNLEDVILGKKVMTEELDLQAKIIQKMQVPCHWLKIYPSLKPLGSWFYDLKERLKFFSNWISSGCLPIKIWLPAFTNPKQFLNASLLNTVKNTNVVLKDLIWEHHVSTLDEKHICEAASDGIFIQGFFLQGAGWDKTNSILVEPDPLSLIIQMPVIYFKPVTETSIRGAYNCPCYYTSKRTDEEGNSSELFAVNLKTKEEKEYWRKRNICLLLSEDA